MSFNDESTLTRLKKDVSPERVLRYFDVELSGDKCKCLFHDDSNPSMQVKEHTIICFACGKTWDVIDIVRKFLSLEFIFAVEWLDEHEDKLPPSQLTSTSSEYRGPVSLDLVEFWHNSLTDTLRQRLLDERMLTNETIDKYKIGWRPEWSAWSLPFWSGDDVVTMQFRITDDTPEYLKRSKFLSLSGHGIPAVVGLPVDTWAIMVFGTFDAYLGVQDGLPFLSPNGAGAFAGKKHKSKLQDILINVDRLYVVYDYTPSERESARRSVSHLSCEIIEREFTESYKDYGDYRKDHTVSDFIRDILKWGVT